MNEKEWWEGIFNLTPQEQLAVNILAEVVSQRKNQMDSLVFDRLCLQRTFEILSTLGEIELTTLFKSRAKEIGDKLQWKQITSVE